MQRLFPDNPLQLDANASLTLHRRAPQINIELTTLAT